MPELEEASQTLPDAFATVVEAPGSTPAKDFTASHNASTFPARAGYAAPVASIARILGISMLLTASLAGCPRELVAPPAAGDVCTTTGDCNLGLTCGELRACVGGRCEEGHSIRVPCR